MNEFGQLAAAVTAELDAFGARYAMVGGFAVSARTEPRFTKDVDLVVAVKGDHEAEQIVHRLITQGFVLDATIEQATHDRMATARLWRFSTELRVDLLFASSGIEAELVDAAEVLQAMSGLRLPVARTGHLIALKLLARDDDRRPQDMMDLRGLAIAATDEDVAMAETAIALIKERGFHRGRDLDADLAGFVDDRKRWQGAPPDTAH